MGTKKTLFLLLSVVMALALVLLIPLDFFYHGFYCEPIAYGNISEEDLLSTVDVSQEAYTTTFSPQEKRFAGCEVFIADLPEDTAGELVFTTYNQKGEMLESLEAEISTKINYHAFLQELRRHSLTCNTCRKSHEKNICILCCF